MSGHCALGGDALQERKFLQPSFQTPIKRGHAAHEEQIRGDQGAGLPVEGREVTVRVGDAVRGQFKRPAAQINLRLIAHEHGGHHQRTDRVLAQYRLRARAIVLPAQRQSARQARMTHVDRMIRAEGARAEYVIRMDVGHQNIANRKLGRLADARAQAPAVIETATRVRHGNRFAADDETNIGDGIVVRRAHVLIDAAPDMDAGGDFRGNPRARILHHGGRPCRHRARGKPHHHSIPTRAEPVRAHWGVAAIAPARRIVSSRVWQYTMRNSTARQPGKHAGVYEARNRRRLQRLRCKPG